MGDATRDVQIGLEVYRQHIAATNSGMELMGGGSKRLPCNVSSVKGSRAREAMREILRKAEEIAIHPFSEQLLAELTQEIAHRRERRVIKSESAQLQFSNSGAVCTLSGCCDLRLLALQ